MLNPRIYRAAFLPVVVAVMVLAFSFRSEPAALSSNLAPAAFNAQDVASTMCALEGRPCVRATGAPARGYQSPVPGSARDAALAGKVSRSLAQWLGGGAVSEQFATAETAVGPRQVATVIAQRTGSSAGRIVVLASRDGLKPGAPSALSGTATLIELARVLAGRTLNRTLELISTSGSAGLAGAANVAASLGGPIDAVIVLGDAAASRVSEPVVVPWSSGSTLAPLLLRNTAAAAVRSQASIAPGGATLAGQFVRLALPLTMSDQGPFNASGIPAVMISRGGERDDVASGGSGATAVASLTEIGNFGSAALQTITALDGGPEIPPPSAYLTYSHMQVPQWPVRLLVLTLILPVLATTVDAFARARRRGFHVGRCLLWVLAAALPFALVSVFIAALGVGSLVQVAPPGPAPPGAVPVDAGSVFELIAALAVFGLAMWPLRSLIVRHLSLDGDAREGGGAVATLILLCVVVLALWVANPFAAALGVLALHLWMWVVAPEVRFRALVAFAMLLAGLAPLALVVVYYASQFGLGLGGVVWTSLLLVAGGGLSLGTLLLWSVFGGCAVSCAVIAVRTASSAAAAAAVDAPVTIRGPVTYAGPGSLGGTKSALRR